jgi:hypothetical protein
MPVRMAFALADALRLAEHASTAPTNLRRPGSPHAGTPALQLIVETLPGLQPVVYLLSSGVPCLSKPDGAPLALYADRTPTNTDRWPADPHEVIDLHQLVPDGTSTGRPLPVAHGWYLPLQQPGQPSLLEVMRTAADTGYSHITIDAASLTVGVAKHRRRHPQPC